MQKINTSNTVDAFNTLGTIGNRAFAVAGPEAWNSLPVDIRSSETVTLFKNRLKTYLFKLSY